MENSIYKCLLIKKEREGTSALALDKAVNVAATGRPKSGQPLSTQFNVDAASRTGGAQPIPDW